MYDICCIGHITLDKVVTPAAEKHMAGGTSFYFSNALSRMYVNYCLVTSLAASEMHFVANLCAGGVTVIAIPADHTVYFENIYSQNLDQRTQRVLQTAGSFTVEHLKDTEAAIFHLGPLLANDIPINLIKALAQKGKVSLDVQGYLRKVQHQEVVAADWPDKKEALRYVHFLKADDYELELLTGVKDVKEGCKILHAWGVEEVVITFAGRGSLIYADDIFYKIPAYTPAAETDATGCGDTYIAGYLYQRMKGRGVQQAGEFGAAMASLKIAASGPFSGTEEEVFELLDKNKNK
jgi:sugar/nucleoside kinase (ribokinase family)